jgi:hypothetical protein
MPPSANDIAVDVASCLNSRDEALARRLIYGFIQYFDRADLVHRGRMVSTRPVATGDVKFDALLAATVEFVCVRHDQVIPDWVAAPEYFLDEFWFVSGLRSLEAEALQHSPISYSRRAIFLHRDSLTYA